MEGENRERYRECLRNHAASLGSYATDGCGEFTFEDTCSSSPPSGGGGSSFHCAACGCHRNFHRKVVTHGHASPAPGGGSRRELEYMALVAAAAAAESPSESDRSGSGGKKRFRTKFTPEQKEKMLEFAEKLGWKLQRKDLEDEIDKFCRSLGVTRQVFKVWMHNHKNSSSNSPTSASTGNASSLTTQ